MKDFLIKPYILRTLLNGSRYRIFMEQVLPVLLMDIPTVVRNEMLFQHYGVTYRFQVAGRNYLTANFAAGWIGHGGHDQ